MHLRFLNSRNSLLRLLAHPSDLIRYILYTFMVSTVRNIGISLALDVMASKILSKFDSPETSNFRVFRSLSAGWVKRLA
jgi:hypothetical protein